MSGVVFSQLAEDDLIEIWLTIAADDVEAADSFIEAGVSTAP